MKSRTALDPIQIALVDDDASVAEALALGFSSLSGFHLAVHFSSGPEALAGLRDPAELPDVVLMDIRMPGMNGIECTRIIRGMHPTLPIIMLTGSSEGSTILEAFLNGASGYLLKPVQTSDCAAAIQKVLAGSECASPEATEQLIHCLRTGTEKAAGLETLTSREHQVLCGLIRQQTAKEIASELGITPATVNTHIHQTYRKLGVTTHLEAVQHFLDSTSHKHYQHLRFDHEPGNGHSAASRC
ncbi:MAG: response regulator transcription factor [Verrucomicrobia bacterium]|nr:response regulator transcription factor [Verrucomicrobiota bacterium]